MWRFISIMMAVIGLFTTGNAQGMAVDSFVNGLLEQYPKARLLDIYKSSFQDFMGAEHLVADAASARNYLEQELATTDTANLQSWYYEPCGMEGRYVRVRPSRTAESKPINCSTPSFAAPTSPIVPMSGNGPTSGG